MNRIIRTICCLCLVMVVMTGAMGCHRDWQGEPQLEDLYDSCPAFKIRAIKWFGDRGDSRATPALVECLLDQNRSVRFYAIAALEKITGETHGYHYQDNLCERKAALQRWRESLKRQQP